MLALAAASKRSRGKKARKQLRKEASKTLLLTFVIMMKWSRGQLKWEGKRGAAGRFLMQKSFIRL